jgi:hypothetical protein
MFGVDSRQRKGKRRLSRGKRGGGAAEYARTYILSMIV